VKRFNPTKGYEFIQPSGGGGRDVFVHISAVERAGLSSLTRDKPSSTRLRAIAGKSPRPTSRSGDTLCQRNQPNLASQNVEPVVRKAIRQRCGAICRAGVIQVGELSIIDASRSPATRPGASPPTSPSCRSYSVGGCPTRCACDLPDDAKKAYYPDCGGSPCGRGATDSCGSNSPSRRGHNL
jgi:CspA family cold shock protein